MKTEVKLTKQGVADLGGNSQTVRKRCLHSPGQVAVVGRQLVQVFGVMMYENVLGRRCVWCRKVMP